MTAKRTDSTAKKIMVILFELTKRTLILSAISYLLTAWIWAE